MKPSLSTLLAAYVLTLAALLLPGCSPPTRVIDADGEDKVEDKSESLEGPMYEPSGLSTNPARPRSTRPAPAPGP